VRVEGKRATGGRVAKEARAGNLVAGVDRSSATKEDAHSRERLIEIQRSRLLTAAVRAVDELGYANATVAQITARAGVSRRTFYELFVNREVCLTAVMDDILELIDSEIAAAQLDDLPWRERVRGGLWTILCFFDREPVLAQVCVVQSLHGGSSIMERRTRILARLASTVDKGRHERARASDPAALTAEGVVGAAFAIVHARLLRRERGRLADLLGELMGMIVLPYQGAAAAAREQARPALEARGSEPTSSASTPVGPDPLAALSIRLTYRTARVLEGVAEHPRLSNRMVAEYAGISDQGQVSKLLARLRSAGLLVNTGEGHTRGEANAWVLTAKGHQVAESIHMRTRPERRAA
jgi:AcrR family transcriptional regulator